MHESGAQRGIAVRSADGTTIGVAISGSGPPLVLVHGISSDAERWAPVLPGLGEHYTVHAMDRRGRGASGDHAEYDIARELEDVAAVLTAIAEPAFLFGHSFGGLCTLHAMLLGPPIRKLALYEPYAPLTAANEPSAVTREFEALAALGERDAVVTRFMREIVQLNDGELRMMRAQPSWAARLAAAHTIPRELRAAEQFRFDASRFKDVTTPIGMFVGGDSVPFMKDATARIHAALPTSQIFVLEGQKHAAMNTAPSLFVQELHAFLSTGGR